MKKNKHRANLYSQKAQHAVNRKQIKRSRRKPKRTRAGCRLAKEETRLARERQKTTLIKVATYNVRSLSVKGANR